MIIMKFFKWVLIGIGSVIVVVLFMMLGIQIYLNTEQVQARIQAKVNQKIPGTLTWSRNRFSILGGKVDLNDVLLKGPENNKLMELDRLFIHVSWTGLLNGEINVNDIFFENPKVSLSKDRSGNLDLIQAFYSPKDTPSESEKSSDLPFNVVVRRLKVFDGFFQYKTAEEAADNQKDHVVLQNLNLLITDVNVGKQKGRLACQIEGVNIRSRGVRTAIDQLSLTADVRKDRIDALVLDVNTGGLDVNLTGTVENPFADRPILNLGLKSRVFLSQIKDLIPLSSDVSGEVQLNSTLEGASYNPDIDLNLSYKGGALFGNRIDQIHLNCHLKDRSLNIRDLNLYTFVGRFDITGNIDFKKAFADGLFTANPDLDAIDYKFSIRQKASQIANLPLGMSGVKGDVNADIELQGKGVDPRTLWANTSLKIYTRKLSLGKGRSPLDVQVTSQAGMENGYVKIRNFSADAGRTRFEMNGGYDIFSHQVAAHFKLETPDLTEVMSNLGITGVLGRINVSGEVSGTAKAPFMDARLKGENLGFANVRLGNADANIRFSKGQFFLKNGKIFNGNSKLDISGSAQIFDPMNYQRLKTPGFDVALKGDTLFLGDFVEGMTGKFVLNGRVNGDTAHPKGKLELNGENIDLNIQKVHDIQLSLDFDDDRIKFDPFSILIAPGERILVDGWVSLNKNYELRLTSVDISLKNITPLHLGDVDNGKISFNFEGKGNFENPKIKGKVVLNDLRFNTQHLKDIQLEIEVKDHIARISGDPNFALDANYHLQTKAFSASAVFDNTNLTPYLKIVGRNELNGIITGKIEVKGNTDAPDQIKGSADVSRVEILKKQTELIGVRDFKAFLEDGKISIPGVRLNLLKRRGVEIKGNGKLNGDLDLEADGNLPLEIIPLLTDIIPNTTGEAGLSLSMRGNLSRPDFRIDVELINAGMAVPVLLQGMHDLNGSVHVTPEAIVLDNIQGMLDTGHFKLSGAIDLKEYEPSRVGLKLKADDLPIMIPGTLETRLSAELDIRGTPEKSLVSGDIQMLEGKYYKDIQLNLVESLGKKSREEVLVASEIPWPFLKNMALDITTRHREPFVVDNNMALLALKPDLNIYGSVNRPLVSGRAEVESGTVYFQRKEFNVKKGVFDFINPYKIEPTIDIQSEVEIREWAVFLNVSGTPDNLKFNLSSNPSETKEDILSLLITGKTTQELIAGEGGSSLSPGQMLADVLAETVQKEIKDATGLDIVALEYHEAKDAEESNEVKVTVGKELSRRVTVKYGMQTKNAKVIQRVMTEYKFLEKVLMNTFQDTEGHYGGGLQFRLEFR